MIYIEVGKNEESVDVWMWERKELLIALIESTKLSKSNAIYVAATGAQLLKSYDFKTTEEMRSVECHNTALRDYFIHLADMIDAAGLDTILYKTWEMNEFTTEPIHELRTYLNYHKNAHKLHAQKVYMTDEEAKAALLDDSEWNFNKGEEAREKLAKLFNET